MGSVELSKSFERLGREKKAVRVRECGSYLVFRVGEDGRKKLHSANFCRVRLCPMCMWRKSLKVFSLVSQVMDMAERRDGLQPIFITLTVENVEGHSLMEALDSIFEGWKRLVNNKRVKRIFPGWFRSLEVTHNSETDEYHPHLHALLLVKKGYFRKSSKDYIDTRGWSALWKKSVRAVGYDPVCYAEAVKSGGKKSKGLIAAEVSKYTLKSKDYIFKGDDEKTDRVVKVLSSALHGRRLYSFGGVMKAYAKEAEKRRDASEAGGEEEEIREDIADMLAAYSWDMGVSNYVISRVEARLEGGGRLEVDFGGGKPVGVRVRCVGEAREAGMAASQSAEPIA